MTNENPNNDAAAAEKPAGARRRLKSRKMLFFLGLAAIVLAVVLGYPLYLGIMSHESTDDAFVEAHVVSMSPRVAGHVARVPVHDNQWVEKGELLVQVDPRTFEVALDIARARLQSAKAAMEEAEAEVAAARSLMAQRAAALSSNRAAMAQARAGVQEYTAGHDRDENDFKRMDEMVEAGAVSRQEYDHARAQAAVSRAKLQSAKKNIDTQSAQIRQAQASAQAAGDGLRQAQAAVEQRQAEAREAEAQVRQAELDLSYTRITAPCAGFVTKKSVEPGAYVQVGQKLLSVVSRDVWVVANFKETQISGMRPGQPVDIEVDAYPGVDIKGHVDSIQRGTGSRFTLLPPENATGNFIKVVQRVPVKIVLDRPNGEDGRLLAPGMSVIPRVNVAVQSDDNRSACAEQTRATAVQ
ncbi:HlyD family secretion protein [Desulfovibrio sp. Huiquan2017]|uniref:HlyD family secretion protein n=1 Tax=Desulfovibrio sp. Huiquan2017 TaxID=2816861 RepID=UPI001A91A0F0|nr:HlyD family secretion protein [Desulfovibrio sp. Huiquan2017]